MRLYELVPPTLDLVVHNEETCHTMVLTPQGAVYNTENTDDVRNIAIAFGLLTTSDAWRYATQEEIAELRAHPPTPMMELNWVKPQPKPRPVLTVVPTKAMVELMSLPDLPREPAKVIYEKDGMKIYDDDDTQ